MQNIAIMILHYLYWFYEAKDMCIVTYTYKIHVFMYIYTNEMKMQILNDLTILAVWK